MLDQGKWMKRLSRTSTERAKVVGLVKEFPEAEAIPNGTHLSLEVRGKRFGWYLDNHHDDGRIAINCKAAKGDNESLWKEFPERYHIPKYVGHHGWIGLWLDVDNVDWREVGKLLNDAYRLTAPKRLVSKLEDAESDHD